MRIAVASFLTVVLVLYGAAAGAADSFLPSIQRIVDRGSLVIAVIDGTRPPMITRGKDGAPSGFDIDLGREIALSLGVKPEFVAAGPRNDDILEMVAAGQADIGLSYLSENVDWAKRVFFSQPYLIEAHTVFINRLSGTELQEECPRPSDLRRMAKKEDMLGIPRYGFYVRYLEQSVDNPVAKQFDTIDEMIAAVAAGDIVVSVQGELSAKYYLTRHPEASIRLRFCNVPGVRHRVAIAVRPDGLDLTRWLDLYIAQRGVIIDLDSLIYRADRTVN